MIHRIAFRHFFALVLPLVVALAVSTQPARAADVDGAKDHPLVARFPGSSLIGYFQRDWEATVFPLAADIDTGTQVLKKSVGVEGKVTRLYYLSPVGTSPLEVFRSYEQAFAKAGLKTVFSCDTQCGQLFFRWRFGKLRNDTRWVKDTLQSADGKGSRWAIQDAMAEGGRGLYGTLTNGDAIAHVFVYTSIAGYAPTNAAATVIEIAEPKAMKDGQVQVDATAMASGLAAEGRVVLGGIFFDTGKAVLKPESDAQLEQMAKMLQAQPALQVFIVGHTDNQGSFDTNLALSKQRAEAVRDALVGRFKVDGKRITPFGAANVSPVAGNSAEAGRARNRRVELVER
jgi:OmpA-OmpF porin, OOP family